MLFPILRPLDLRGILTIVDADGRLKFVTEETERFDIGNESIIVRIAEPDAINEFRPHPARHIVSPVRAPFRLGRDWYLVLTEIEPITSHE